MSCLAVGCLGSAVLQKTFTLHPPRHTIPSTTDTRRVQCTVCENYFLCEECMEAGVHVDENHEFERIEPPDGHDEDGEL